VFQANDVGEKAQGIRNRLHLLGLFGLMASDAPGATDAIATHSDWALLYQELLAELGTILANSGADENEIREHLHSLLAAHRACRPASRAEIVRGRRIDGVRPVRSLLSALVRLPWAATDQHPVREASRRLQDLYAHEQRHLPVDQHPRLRAGDPPVA
jgi:hypothetical protein